MSKDKLIGLVQQKELSSPFVIKVIREALTHARSNDMTSVFIVMVPSDNKGEVFIKATTHTTAEDIDNLLSAVEEGHEIVYQLDKQQ